MRRYLQYLWLRNLLPRRIIDYIGATEGSKHYQYIRKACGEEYAKMCSNMPPLLKQNGFEMIFRNIIMAPLYYERIYDILRKGEDPVMSERVNRTMKGSIVYLCGKVIVLRGTRVYRDVKSRFTQFFRRIKWHGNRIDISTIQDMVEDVDFDCVFLSNKFLKSFAEIHKKVYGNLCEKGLKPAFILISDRFFIDRKAGGSIVELPFQTDFLFKCSSRNKILLKEAILWASGLRISGRIKKKIIRRIRLNYVQYVAFQEIAKVILGAGKARSLIILAENEIELRVFLYQAKQMNIPTVLFYHIDSIEGLIYDQYLSDHILVCNHIQQRNFIELGYSPEQCTIVGSASFPRVISQLPADFSGDKKDVYKIIYFTKGTRSIDEGILTELREKLESLSINYHLIIKKHPKDTNTFKRLKNKNVVVTSELDFMKLVENSDLVITQYSSVARMIFPLGKSIIVYTYSDILEYGERDFFKNVNLPNYLMYVQNKEEFHRAIERLLDIKETDVLPKIFAEDLYGFLDNKCGDRIAKKISLLVLKKAENV